MPRITQEAGSARALAKASMRPRLNAADYEEQALRDVGPDASMRPRLNAADYLCILRDDAVRVPVLQ